MERYEQIEQVDLHCHVLPGLDDGARDIEHALAMLQVAAADGTQIIVATPHARRCEAAAVLAEAERLREAAARRGLALQLLTGMEEQLLPDLLERLATGAALPLGSTRWVLVELPDWTTWPPTISVQLEALRTAGFRPILAHVERYIPVQRDPTVVLEAIAAGALLQVNADSLFGQNGHPAQQTAVRLVRAGAVSVLASDAHSPDWRAPRLRAAFDRVAALVDPERAQRLRENALAIVHDTDLLPPQPDEDSLTAPLSLLDRVRAWVGV